MSLRRIMSLDYICICSIIKMNFLSIFGAGKSEKKKKKNKRSDRIENEVWALKGVTMRVSSLMGSGPKKQECQDTCCML